jgi:hypothetical protein
MELAQRCVAPHRGRTEVVVRIPSEDLLEVRGIEDSVLSQHLPRVLHGVAGQREVDAERAQAVLLASLVDELQQTVAVAFVGPGRGSLGHPEREHGDRDEADHRAPAARVSKCGHAGTPLRPRISPDPSDSGVASTVPL